MYDTFRMSTMRVRASTHYSHSHRSAVFKTKTRKLARTAGCERNSARARARAHTLRFLLWKRVMRMCVNRISGDGSTVTQTSRL